MRARCFTKHTIKLFFLLLILSSFLITIPKAKANHSETRYFRSDTHTVNTYTLKILGTAKSGAAGLQSVTWQTTTQPSLAYVRVLVQKVAEDGTRTDVAVGAVATINVNTAVVVNETLAVPETSLLPTDAILVEVQYSTNGVVWTALSSVLLGADWITEQLGATVLNGATWTVYYDLDFVSTYNPALRRYQNTLTFRYDGNYASRIENFAWATITKTWNNVTLWNLVLLTRKWQNIADWNLPLIIKQWSIVASWVVQFVVRTWHSIGFWILNLETITRTWRDVTSWIFQILTKQWNFVSLWNLQLLTKQWNAISLWILQILTRQWNMVDVWYYAIFVKGWQNVATWIFQFLTRKVWWTISTWIFDIPSKAWNFIVYLTANLNVYIFPFIILLGGAFIITIAVLWIWRKR